MLRACEAFAQSKDPYKFCTAPSPAGHFYYSPSVSLWRPVQELSFRPELHSRREWEAERRNLRSSPLLQL